MGAGGFSERGIVLHILLQTLKWNASFSTIHIIPNGSRPTLHFYLEYPVSPRNIPEVKWVVNVDS